MFEPDELDDEEREDLEELEESEEEEIETLEELTVDEDGHVRPRRHRKDEEENLNLYDDYN